MEVLNEKVEKKHEGEWTTKAEETDKEENEKRRAIFCVASLSSHRS